LVDLSSFKLALVKLFLLFFQGGSKFNLILVDCSGKKWVLIGSFDHLKVDNYWNYVDYQEAGYRARPTEYRTYIWVKDSKYQWEDELDETHYSESSLA
jgi:hypothetical protein